MFKFLKDKLKKAVSQFSKKIEEQGKEEVKEVEVKPKKGLFAKIKKRFVKEEIPKEKPKVRPEVKIEKKIKKPKPKIKKKEVIKEEKPEIKIIKKEIKPKPEIKEIKPKVKVEKPKIVEEIPEVKKGIFAKIKEKIVTKKISEVQFEDMFWNLEIILLENNVAVEVVEKIKQDLKQSLVNKPLPRTKITQTITTSLKTTIEGLFKVEKIDVIQKAKEKKPLIICFVGINGSGKTTTIAKMVKLFQNKGLSCVIAASDTFRAAAIDQLQKHADNLGIKLIKHDYGADAAAVAFDAVKHAQAKNIDVVLIDTAGRMHSNINLMDEMKKIIRVANPDLKIFVGESITGNDCTEQAKKFNEAVGIDGIILSKADVDEKGGAAISVSHVTGKPILFLGTGQKYEDLKEFEPEIILKSLDLK